MIASRSSPRKNLLILLGAVLLASPLSGQETSLAVEEVFATTGKGQELAPFSYVTSVVEAPSGEIWVADSYNENIMALSSEGEQLREVASTGPGPGEVGKPMMMTALPSDRGVAVYDARHLTIELFGPDGSFRERLALSARPIFPKGFAALPDGRFVISGGDWADSSSVHLLGQDGERVAGFLPRRAPEQEGRIARRAAIYLSGGALTVDAAGRIVFSKAAPHRIMRLDPETGEHTVLAEDEDLLAYPGRGFYEKTDAGWDPWFEYPRSVFIGELPDGRILNVVRFEGRGESLFQLYGSGGEPVASLRVGKAYTPHALTDEGTLLASYRRPVTGEHVVTELALTY